MPQRYRSVYWQIAESSPRRCCDLFGGILNRYGVHVYALDEATRQRFFALSLLVHDIDGSLAPAVLPGPLALDFEHGLYLHPCPLRTVVLWIDGDMWMYRNLELNITDGTVYKVGEAQQLAPLDHPLLAEQLARMLARCGREIVSNVADRIIVPRDAIADVFGAHLAGAARLSFSARAWLTRNGYQAEW
ncbi:MAG TPA: hypothetical protein VHZ98_01860 [Galbitalea sp.]|jgi:hypothetical protein|nr:hypothetical protein [Galbitalea sp.]